MYLRRRNFWNRREYYNFEFKNKNESILFFLCVSLLLILSLGATWLLISARRGKAITNEKKQGILRDKIITGFPPLAKVGKIGLILFLPSEASTVITIGYHEAENPKTLSLRPIGYCVDNDNPEKMDRELPIIKGDIPFFILNQRGRKASATSAVDICVKPDTEIVSPVDGEITKIKRYFLYGKYEDFHLEIMPDGYPDLRIAMIHLENLRVRVGDRVKQGRTVLANIRSIIKIRSQIDRYTGNNFGHIHLQVNPFNPEEQIPGS